MPDESTGEPLASTPKRRVVTRRPKGPAEPPMVIEAEVSDPDATPQGMEQVAVHQSAVGRVEASQVTVEQGAIGAARAESVKVERGAFGAALGEQVEFSRSYARTIVARQVRVLVTPAAGRAVGIKELQIFDTRSGHGH